MFTWHSYLEYSGTFLHLGHQISLLWRPANGSRDVLLSTLLSAPSLPFLRMVKKKNSSVQQGQKLSFAHGLVSCRMCHTQLHNCLALQLQPEVGQWALRNLDLQVFILIQVAGAVTSVIRTKARTTDLPENRNVLLPTKPGLQVLQLNLEIFTLLCLFIK